MDQSREASAVARFVAHLLGRADELQSTNRAEAKRLRRQAERQVSLASAEDLIQQALEYALEGPRARRKTLNRLVRMACDKVGDGRAKEMLARAFAKGAAAAADQLVSDKLFKYACRFVPPITVAEAFAREGLRVHCPVSYPRWVSIKHPEETRDTPIVYMAPARGGSGSWDKPADAERRLERLQGLEHA